MNDTVATEDQEQPATPHERKARSHDRDPDSRTPSRPADICSASTGRTYDRSRPNRSKRQNSACHGGPSTYEELGVKRIVSWRQWQISNICLSGIQGPEPDCMTRLVSEHDQPHIRSPFATAAPTSRLRRARLRKTRTILENGVFSHGLLRFVDLDPSGLLLSWGLRDWLGAYRQAVFITAPSMTMPAVTYFQRATSSFRATATIVVLRRRPPLRFTRSWNQRASAESG
jgi:hypothetical protein